MHRHAGVPPTLRPTPPRRKRAISKPQARATQDRRWRAERRRRRRERAQSERGRPAGRGCPVRRGTSRRRTSERSISGGRRGDLRRRGRDRRVSVVGGAPGGDVGFDSQSELGELGEADDPAELALGLAHPDGDPAQAHVAVVPALDGAADAPDGLDHRLAAVHRGERALEPARSTSRVTVSVSSKPSPSDAAAPECVWASSSARPQSWSSDNTLPRRTADGADALLDDASTQSSTRSSAETQRVNRSGSSTVGGVSARLRPG